MCIVHVPFIIAGSYSFKYNNIIITLSALLLFNRSVDVDPSLPEQLYHVIQCVVFGGLALLVMRLKVFLTPQLAVLSCLLVKVKVRGNSGRIYGLIYSS